MKVLVVDDDQTRYLTLLRRKLIPENSVWAHTALIAIELINEHGPWDEVMLDHDLATVIASGPEVTGLDVAKALVTQRWKPSRVIIHSMNSVGSSYMYRLLTDHQIPVEKIPYGLIISTSA